MLYRLTELYLRAGGGHNFGGGGSRSSGGGGFRSSGGGSSGFHSSGTGGGGIIGLIVLVVLGLFALVIFLALRGALKRARAGMAAAGVAGAPPFFPPPGAGVPPPTAGSPFTPPPTAPEGEAPVDPVTAGINAIRAHDPAFEDDKFITDAQRSFFTVQQAWTELKPDMSRRVMADNIWQQHKVQIEGYQSQNKRNVLEGLAIANAVIIKAESEGGYDTIVLRLLAGCADYDIDINSNKVVRGNKDFRQWAEDWTFQRSDKATTKEAGGTMQQRCPNCGAPLDLDLSGICKYCHEAVMSGDYDWVLIRIDQVQYS